MEGVAKRVRLSFEDGKILRKSQRKEGLNLSWLLLKSSHETVSDISSYIYRVFELHRSCPNGIILTMDGFVLPPFESASILKDNDIIGVKRKEKSLLEITNGDDGENVNDQKEITEHENLNLPLLANEEFEMESDGYLSESDEPEEEEQQEDNQSGDGLYEEKSPDRNKISKKRKASKKSGSSKKKKKKKSLIDIQPLDQMQATATLFNVDENASNGIRAGENSDTKKKKSKDKKKRKRARTLVSVEINDDTNMNVSNDDTKKKLSKVEKKHKRASAHVSVESSDDTSQPLSSPKNPIQENGMEHGASSQVPDGAEKKPSRSARRKKAKRQWLREIVKAEKEQLLLLNGASSQPGNSDVQLKNMQSLEINANNQCVEHPQQKQSCEADNEITPDADTVSIIIRPGHIRFEPLEDDADGERLQQRHVSTEIIQWNGITNKKKGQKWGKENSTFWRNQSQSSNNKQTEIIITEELKTPNDVKPPNDSIDFDNLAPLSRLPKEGDLIAYRIVELSSTWTPELTSFRVGKTSWYDNVSNKILLTPLPEYPIVIEKLDEEEETFAQPPDNSLYKEDGSLEVDFSSLVDVRMVKESDSNPVKTTSDGPHVPLISNGATSSTAIPSENENKEKGWDEISEALNAKKDELMRENSWNKENSSKGGWSYRAMRGSAMGPIMARLRANNEI